MPDLQFTDYISKTEHSKTQQNAWSPIHRLEVLFKYWKFCEFVDDIRILNNLGEKTKQKIPKYSHYTSVVWTLQG